MRIYASFCLATPRNLKSTLLFSYISSIFINHVTRKINILVPEDTCPTLVEAYLIEQAVNIFERTESGKIKVFFDVIQNLLPVVKNNEQQEVWFSFEVTYSVNPIDFRHTQSLPQRWVLKRLLYPYTNRQEPGSNQCILQFRSPDDCT